MFTGIQAVKTLGREPLRAEIPSRKSSIGSKVAFLYLLLCRRVASRRHQKLFFLSKGGHHVHLSDAEAVVKSLRPWLLDTGGLVAYQGKSDESISSSSSSSPTPPTPAAPAAPSSKETPLDTPAPKKTETPVERPAPTMKVSVGAKAALLSKESSKTQEEIAKAYDKAREETQEIS